MGRPVRRKSAPVPGTNPTPPGLRRIHRLANRGLLASLLLSSILCVLELQVRLNMNRTYTAIQEARTMQQLYLDSRSQLVTALSTEQGDRLATQSSEPLLLPPPPSPQARRRFLWVNPGRWLNAGAVLRGY